MDQAAVELAVLVLHLLLAAPPLLTVVAAVEDHIHRIAVAQAAVVAAVLAGRLLPLWLGRRIQAAAAVVARRVATQVSLAALAL